MEHQDKKATLETFLSTKGIKAELMTAQECIQSLHWYTQYDFLTEGTTGRINCSCGGVVQFFGWFTPERLACKECQAGMQDLRGMLPGEYGQVDTAQIEIPDGRRTWIPINLYKGSK